MPASTPKLLVDPMLDGDGPSELGIFDPSAGDVVEVTLGTPRLADARAQREGFQRHGVQALALGTSPPPEKSS